MNALIDIYLNGYTGAVLFGLWLISFVVLGYILGYGFGSRKIVMKREKK